jgi:hypothetical protein
MQVGMAISPSLRLMPYWQNYNLMQKCLPEPSDMQIALQNVML